MSKTSIKCIHLVYFSPSGSTEKIVRKIATVIQGLEVKTYNLLPSAARKQQYVFGKEDLVIYGSLSAGMLFTKAEEIFNCLQGNETPFIGVISFGNAYYGVALTEMKERAESRGFRVCALGAFVSRHTMNGGPRKYLMTALNAKSVFVTVPWTPSTLSRKNLTLTAALPAMAA